jgi:hypothetical protein
VRIVGGWCEMAASFEVTQLEKWVSSETVSGQWGREHGSWGSYGIGSRYQVTTGDDTADWEELVLAVVNCRVYELAIAL